MLRALVFGDLHLGRGDEYDPLSDIERLDIDVDVDVVVSIGDVIEQSRDHAKSAATGLEYEQRGRDFFQRLEAQFDVPILAVPGNHDPLDCTERLVEDRERVVLAHDSVLTSTSVPGADDSFDGIEFVARGCEQFDQRSIFDHREYPGLDVLADATSDDVDFVARQTAERREEAVGRFLAGVESATETAATLGIAPDNRAAFAEDLDGLRERYEQYATLFESADGETVLLSHLSPYFVAFDYHHSHTGLAGRLHSGSIPLKMALLNYSPFVTFCGHLHTDAVDVVETTGAHCYVRNLGKHGVGLAEIDTDRRTFHAEHFLE